MSKAMLAASVLMLAVAGPAAGHPDSAFPLIDWSIDASRNQAEKVQLEMRTRSSRGNESSNWSTGYSVSELQGLAGAQLAARVANPVRFALVRDAGRLDCSGSAGNRAGSGTCRFSADEGFAAFLQSRGIGRPDLSNPIISR